MFSKSMLCLVLAILCILGLGVSVFAAEVDCDTVYCFSPADFSTAEEPLTGICITDLPQPETGTILLGSRVLRKGDILTAQQIEQMTFQPLDSQEDATASVEYLPIYANRVDHAATMTISIHGKENLAPQVEGHSMETYKNLPNKGQLKASDPEGKELTYTVVRQPKRGSVTLNPDGSFVYTPKKNKVGTDSFTFTATDPAGKVSKEATVTIQILKPTNAKQYTDTAGLDCRFEAEWLKNTGLFVGESVNGKSCFQPDKTVSNGEFLAMMVKALNIPTKNADTAEVPGDMPQWLRPYFAAALRSGLVSNLEGEFIPNDPITGAQAAIMLQNALDLTVSDQVLAEVAATDSDLSQWAQAALTVMRYNGIDMEAQTCLTRADVAKVLYQADILSLDAPGLKVIKKQN